MAGGGAEVLWAVGAYHPAWLLVAVLSGALVVGGVWAGWVLSQTTPEDEVHRGKQRVGKLD